MIGFISVCMALFLSLAAAFFYFNNYLSVVTTAGQKERKISRYGNLFYDGAGAFALLAGIWLLYILLTNQFQFRYVAAYSSLDLPLVYKISAFWAGQEGSFLLWVLFHAAFGVYLQKKAPPGVMMVYSILQAALLVLLLAKNPFVLLAQMRPDGFGMNPLLQDPWMVIHPPILFLGYAGLAVPFAYAMDGLLSKRAGGWAAKALPWTLFSWAALGAGIFIGGFWAYKVLGWGGYWGWDPVENSSLVPWLLTGVLLHTIFLAKKRPAAIALAHFFALLSFVSVLYGTFLTRSGILSNFSTHSFSDEGTGSILAGVVLLTLCISLLVFILRLPVLPQGELAGKMLSREGLLLGAALLLFVLAVFVTIGMSTPLVTMLIGSPQSLQTSFYNVVTLPLALCMAILLTALLFTGKQAKNAGSSKIAPGLLFLLLPLKIGIFSPLLLLTIAAGGTAFFAAIWLRREKRISAGAAVVHMGSALLIIGIILSSAGSQTQAVHFVQGQPQSVSGYTLTYLGEEKADDGSGSWQKFQLAEGGHSVLVSPYTKLNKDGMASAREPGIYRSLMADLYIAPNLQEDMSPKMKKITMHKGDRVQEGALQITFLDISLQGMGSNEVHVSTAVQVQTEGKEELLHPELNFKNGRVSAEPVQAFGQHEFTLYSVSPSDSAIILAYRDIASEANQPQIDVEISHKPLINLVWAGTILIVTGTILAAWKHKAR